MNTFPFLIIFIQFIVMVPFIVGWIFCLVALWRGMKAHEKIATVIEELANK